VSTSKRYKSGLEKKFAQQFALPYEPARLSYVSTQHYCPDWQLARNHFIETKGRWESADRSKLQKVLSQHPGVQVVMVFSNPDQKLSKASKTTYGQWCEKNNIPFFKIGDPALAAYIAANQQQQEGTTP
jgi:hypothetical protein